MDNGKPYDVGEGVLRRIIDSAVGGGRMSDLTVLSANRDPYRLDTPAGHILGRWFAEQVALITTRTVHLRGLHYVLVSQPKPVLKPDGKPYSNVDGDWEWLQDRASKAGRWLGYVGFERIRDERNAAPEIYTPEPQSDTPHVFATIGGWTELPPPPVVALSCFGFVPPRQPYHLALIAEKSSAGDVLRPLALRYGAELILPTGEATDTLVSEMASRAVEDGRPLVVLYFADFDPSGHQMPISVSRKLQALRDLCFPGLDARVIPAALTFEQAKELDLPSTPLKETELRGDRWREHWGREQTEIDALAALRPEVLREIAEAAIAPFFDFSLDERHSRSNYEWNSRAEAWLKQWSGLDRVNAKLSRAFEIFVADVQAYNAAREEAQAELNDAMDTPAPLPEAVEADINEENFPSPLFSTGEDFSTASRRLIAHKKLRTPPSST